MLYFPGNRPGPFSAAGGVRTRNRKYAHYFRPLIHKPYSWHPRLGWCLPITSTSAFCTPGGNRTRTPSTGMDFESIVSTVPPPGFVWAFHVSQRSGPKYEKTFNIYSRALPLCCPGTNRTCIVGTKIQCVSRCTTGQLLG